MRHKKDTNTNYSAIANKQRKISIRKCKIKYGLGLTAAATITSIIGLSQSFSDISSALSISSLSSTSGSVDGGNEIIIKGKGFLKTIDKKDKITQIVGGTTGHYGTVFAITENGRVYSYGNNRYGDAGTGVACNDEDDYRKEPCFYDEPQDITNKFNGERVNKIYDGIAITDKHVYSWGDDYLSPTIIPELSGKQIIGLSRYAAFSDTSIYYYNYIHQQDKPTVKVYDGINISSHLNGATIKDFVSSEWSSYILTSKGSLLRSTVNDDGEIPSFADIKDITGKFGMNVKQVTSLPAGGILVLTGDGRLLRDYEYASTSDITDNVSSIAGEDGDALYFTKNDGGLYYFDEYERPENEVHSYSTGVDDIAIHAYGGYGISFTQNTNPDKICSHIIGPSSIDDFKPCVTIPLQSYKVTEPSIKSLSFGDVTTDKFAIVDDNTLKVTVPRHVAGKVNVKMTDSDNKSTTLKDGYEYVDGTAKRDPNAETTPRQDAAGVKNSANHDNKTITAPNTGV